jgi:hypothetical protein
VPWFEKQKSSRLGTNNRIDPAGSSVSTPAFGAQTYQIRVVTTAAVNIKVGDGTVAATTNDPLMPTGVVDYVTVTPGQKLAAIGTATVHVTEMN